VLPLAEKHAGVRVNGAFAERAVAGPHPRLVALQDARVPLDGLAQPASLRLHIGRPLAAALAAQAATQHLNPAEAGRKVVAGGVHVQGSVGARRPLEEADRTGDRADLVAVPAERLVGRDDPVPAVGREPLAAALE